MRLSKPSHPPPNRQPPRSGARTARRPASRYGDVCRREGFTGPEPPQVSRQVRAAAAFNTPTAPRPPARDNSQNPLSCRQTSTPGAETLAETRSTRRLPARRRLRPTAQRFLKPSGRAPRSPTDAHAGCERISRILSTRPGPALQARANALNRAARSEHAVNVSWKRSRDRTGSACRPSRLSCTPDPPAFPQPTANSASRDSTAPRLTRQRPAPPADPDIYTQDPPPEGAYHAPT